MTTQDCLPYRHEILGHFLEGKPLSSEAREHYIQCVDCIAAVTTELNKEMTDTIAAHGSAVGLPDATRLALEHGQQVLEREFGIHAANKPVAPV